jgi:cytochrome b561
LLSGALGVLLAALLIARAGSVLLGPEFAVGVLPVEPAERTLGRVTPGALLFLVLAVPVVTYLGVGLGELLGAATLVLVVLLALEKYASWSGSGASRWEAQIVAAILAALPSLVLSAFGVPGWIVGAQVGMLLVLLLVPA